MISEEEAFVHEILNNIFSAIFTVECVIKLIGLGFVEYKEDPHNIFDALLVTLSQIEIFITLFNVKVNFSIFRVCRLLRIFKLAKSWKSFNDILKTMFAAFKNIGVFSLLLVLFILMFSVLGLELFANKVLFDIDNRPVVLNETLSYTENQQLY